MFWQNPKFSSAKSDIDRRSNSNGKDEPGGNGDGKLGGNGNNNGKRGVYVNYERINAVVRVF